MERISLTEQLSFSRLIYGMWRLGDDADTTPARTQAKLETCLELGITTLDQADIYGDYTSESLLGQALKQAPHLRERFEIVSKCDIMLISDHFPQRRVKYYDTSRAHLEASVENSLKAMNVEYLDVLLLHRPDPLMDAEETGAALDALVQSGKVRAVGVSNFEKHDWDLLQAAMSQPLVTNQIEASLQELSPFTNGDLAFLQQAGVPPMIWSPLGGGALLQAGSSPLATALQQMADKHHLSPAATAIAWLLKHPAQLMPILGTNQPERIADLAQATQASLSREDWFELYTAALGNEVP